MSNKKFPISYCFAAYNEEEIIEDTIIKLKKKLDSIFGEKSYEILVVENGSTDSTVKILKRIKCKNLRFIIAPKKGHGLALKTAIEKAKYEHIVITGADLPFGFSDLQLALKYWDTYDIVYGSKLHPKSEYITNVKRKISSRIYSGLLKAFFQIGIRDVQGSIFMKKSKITPFLQFCDSENAFFTTQLAIHARKSKLKMYEIPVKRGVALSQERKSKYNILRDGSKMFSSILKEYIKYHRMQQISKKSVL